MKIMVQVIEKAYKKLRLDALVIQQGRLTQGAAKVGKDDLLSMVKYGAEQVFSSEPAKITDEDIDLIISKGESETARASPCLATLCMKALHQTVQQRPAQPHTTQTFHQQVQHP
jgi:hypothetical protein